MPPFYFTSLDSTIRGGTKKFHLHIHFRIPDLLLLVPPVISEVSALAIWFVDAAAIERVFAHESFAWCSCLAETVLSTLVAPLNASFTVCPFGFANDRNCGAAPLAA